MKPILLFLSLVIITGCTPPVKSVDQSIDEAITRQVLDRHIQTFKANDLEGVMADYTEESVLITPDRTFSGLAEIRENFIAAFKALPKDGTTMTLTKTEVSKDVGYMVWTAITPTLEFKYATDTFIIQGGKIIRQTYAGDVVAINAETGD